MKTKKNEKPFDCLAFKATVQAEIQAELVGKTHAEQLVILKEKAERGPLGHRWKQIAARNLGSEAPAADPAQTGHF
jgi:hypothetical protein